MNLFRALRISRPFAYFLGPIIFLVPILLYDITITPILIIQILLLTFPLCFILFGINDIYDIETDLKNPRKNSIEGVILDRKEIPSVLRISAVCAILMFIPALLRPNYLNLIATSLIVFLAYAYSVPPIRLKEKPPLDSFSNAIIIYLISLMGLSYGSGITGFPEQAYYLLFGVMGIHIFTTIMDYTPDLTVGTITFSTFFGKRLSALMSLIIFTFIMFFSGIKNIFINSFNLYCLFISLVVLIRPNEKLARIFFRIMFILFIILAFAYAIYIS